MAHFRIEAFALGDRRPLSVAISNDPLLTDIQRRGAAELLPLPLGSGDAFLAALADQAPFELGDAAHDGKHEAANIGRGVAPCLAKR